MASRLSGGRVGCRRSDRCRCCEFGTARSVRRCNGCRVNGWCGFAALRSIARGASAQVRRPGTRSAISSDLAQPGLQASWSRAWDRGDRVQSIRVRVRPAGRRFPRRSGSRHRCGRIVLGAMASTRWMSQAFRAGGGRQKANRRGYDASRACGWSRCWRGRPQACCRTS